MWPLAGGVSMPRGGPGPFQGASRAQDSANLSTLAFLHQESCLQLALAASRCAYPWQPMLHHYWSACSPDLLDSPAILQPALRACRPNIVHAHDWPTAPMSFGNLTSARSVFTIHNLNYGADLIGRAMGGAAVATTVSPTYAAEVRHTAVHCRSAAVCWCRVAARALNLANGMQCRPHVHALLTWQQAGPWHATSCLGCVTLCLLPALGS